MKAESSMHVLVVKLADLGDVLTATPALRAIRETFPNSRIDALVTPVGAAALAGLDSVDRSFVLEKSQFDRASPALGPIVNALRLGLTLRRQRYDRVFLLHHLFTGAGRLKYRALLAAIGAPWRGGLAETRPSFLTDVAVDRGYGVKHEADYWLDVVRLAGARSERPRMEMAIDAEDRRAAAELIGRSSTPAGRLIALFPGTGPYSQARRWPEERFAEVGRRLAGVLTRAGESVQILVLGLAAEKDLADRVAKAIGPSARSLAGQTGLKVLGAVLESSDLFIGNDGGVMHVAVAVGAPVVAIFGPSNPVSWGPFGATPWSGASTATNRPVVLWQNLACSPCMYRGFVPGTPRGCRARDCLTLTSAEQVVDAAMLVLSERRTSTR